VYGGGYDESNENNGYCNVNTGSHLTSLPISKAPKLQSRSTIKPRHTVDEIVCISIFIPYTARIARYFKEYKGNNSSCDNSCLTIKMIQLLGSKAVFNWMFNVFKSRDLQFQISL
jgi:hypothetical protein